MKSALKIIFIGIVIVGLVASYVFTGFGTQPVRTTNADFQGPTGEPSTNGPTDLPPGK